SPTRGKPPARVGRFPRQTVRGRRAESATPPQAKRLPPWRRLSNAAPRNFPSITLYNLAHRTLGEATYWTRPAALGKLFYVSYILISLVAAANREVTNLWTAGIR